LGEGGQRSDDAFERFLLTPEFLGAFGIIPDRGVFERGVDLDELL
jgi:hypothetical protein